MAQDEEEPEDGGAALREARIEAIEEGLAAIGQSPAPLMDYVQERFQDLRRAAEEGTAVLLEGETAFASPGRDADRQAAMRAALDKAVETFGRAVEKGTVEIAAGAEGFIERLYGLRDEYFGLAEAARAPADPAEELDSAIRRLNEALPARIAEEMRGAKAEVDGAVARFHEAMDELRAAVAEARRDAA